ncbi:MAG: DMT family transporter [Maritimibacter sp.]|nr:DMT family transporter [Maritimibacter sp.]
MNPPLGIALKLGAVTAFVAMQVLIKSTEGRVPPGEVVFFRSFFAFPVILAWLAWTRELRVGLRTDNPMSHVWRGVIGTSSMGLGFAGLQFLPLPEVTALSYAAPILTVIFAAMFLGEEVRAVRIFAVALGMTGVIIVLAPQLSGFGEGEGGAVRALGAVLVLMSAVFAALAQIFLRKMVATERAATVVLYFTLSSTLFSLLTIPFGWVLPGGRDVAFLIAAGALGGIGQGLLTSSYRFAPASLVAPFDYASMIFAIGLGYVLFAEIPTPQTLAGGALVVAAGILIIWRESRLGMNRDKPRRAGAPPQG